MLAAEHLFGSTVHCVFLCVFEFSNGEKIVAGSSMIDTFQTSTVVQDHEEMSAMDVADAIADMHARGRYRKLFLMVETCQASTMFAQVKSPNVFMLAASKKGGLTSRSRFVVLSHIQTCFLGCVSTNQRNDSACAAGENSYSHHSDMQVGVSVIDRFTYYTQQFFSDINLDSDVTMSRWRDELTFERLHSTVITE